MSLLSVDRALSSHDQIARVLGQEILRGVHAPGANMPPEQELLARFQISRTVLREVMKTLAAKGFIVSKTRVGTRVQDPLNWNLFDADVLAWKVSLGLDRAFRQNLYEIRTAIEPACASLAAERRTAEDLAELRRCISAMRTPGHTSRTFAEADLAFHLAIGAASGNPMMRSVAAVIEAALIASFSMSSPTEEEDLHRSTVDAHEAIVDAIEAHDGPAAARAMLHVVQVGFERIEATMQA
jgi:DNA-binding FadR family transcriptional regulator